MLALEHRGIIYNNMTQHKNGSWSIYQKIEIMCCREPSIVSHIQFQARHGQKKKGKKKKGWIWKTQYGAELDNGKVKDEGGMLFPCL